MLTRTLCPPADIDPDSMMESSPESQNEDTDLFPDADTGKTANTGRPLTPQNNHLNAAAPGELSPPQSQSTSQAAAPGGVTANGTADGVERFFAESDTMLGAAQPVEGAPGAGWKSKRAQEEYHRAMESVVDGDFSLKQFGDILEPQQAGRR